MKKKVILVVDELNGFTKIGKLANPGARKLIPNIKNLLERKAKQGWEIFFLADNHEKNDLEFKRFAEHCIEGTDETLVVEELRGFVTPDNYIKKTRYSGFFKTRLGEILRRLGPDEIVVVGIYADICVLFTAADLMNNDYNVTIPKDCTMTLKGTDQVIFALMKDILGVNIVERQEEI